MTKTAYAYLRVSTMIQVEGNSLEGQLKEIEAYCNAFHIELKGVYSDEGKSGKSVQGRPQFQKMMADIEEKQEVNYVIVWKLSRFGRNARESLNSLEFLQEFDVDLIAKEEGIDTSTKQGKFMFTLLAALAEMERENIIEQTTNGKKYNALDGNWNGGMAPYGYRLMDRKLIVNQEEAEVVKKIFSYFLEDECGGYNGVTARLNEEKIKPRQLLRRDRKTMEESGVDEVYLPVMEDWYSTIVKQIIDNPVYCGKIRYGRYKIINENGVQKRKYTKDAIVVDGKHEAIISTEIWDMAQKKRERTGKRFPQRDSKSPDVNNVFNGIAKCPQCGNGMVACNSQYVKRDGTKVVYYQYICGYYNNHKKGKCRKNMIRAEFLEGTVMEAVSKYVNRPNVVEDIARHMDSELDTSKLETRAKELEEVLKALDNSEELQYNILSQIGLNRRYKNFKPEKVEENINKIAEQREETEGELERTRKEIEAIRLNKLSYEIMKKLLKKFSKACEIAPKELRKRLIRSLIKEIKLGYDENGKVIPVSMTLNFTGEQIEFMGDNSGLFGLKKKNVETVVLLSKLKPDDIIEVKVDLDELDATTAETKATYPEIKEYVLQKYGLKAHTAYIAQVKRKYGIDMRKNYNVSKKENPKARPCPANMEEAIYDALKLFAMV